ncbi:CYTH and CHAD domain-containing protein [Corynebacterium uterequi]|uniref:CHAD domain-containing protein n=1 Tax=Corynebacterium uterequi TaxID=1072256 RepID=A0A0G3HFK9_9CORY|nr:CYTH and CHAD domain-containing protein [Corynebacterium uterequi]AKK11540.1 hypothetical protein CUTER_07755 [Corynebacterium uterequi]
MAIEKFLEVEAKFAVDGTTVVPELTQLPGVHAVAGTQVHHLSAIYYDTADLRLTRAKVTLRRRSGGKDDGWHLKLPGDGGRLELSAELAPPTQGQYEVPEELLSQVRALVRDEELIPIAQVDNERTESLLVGEDGTGVAEFCDDRVTAWSLLPGGTQKQWREWELELSGGVAGTETGAEVLAAATTVLIGAGARKSASPSKLVAALGDSLAEAPLPTYLSVDPDPETAAGAVVLALMANRAKLVAYDPKVRRDEWDSVHQMRVATRELRSHLQTFDGIVAGEQVDHLLSELKVLAGMLGSARDAEVVAERFEWLISSEDSGLISAEDQARIMSTIEEEYQRAHRRIVRALDSDRYLELLDALDELLAHPPVAVKDETESITAVMESHLDEAYRKLVKRHKKAVANWDNPELSLHEREDYYHDMRKAAKKLRYAAEAVGSATGLKTKRIVKACKTMQTVLGDFQDSVTSRTKLERMAHTARRHQHDTFSLGLLYQRERAIGLASLDQYQQAYDDIVAAYRRLKKNR